MGKASWSWILALGALAMAGCSEEIALPEIHHSDLDPAAFEPDPDPRLRDDPNVKSGRPRPAREEFRPSPGGAGPIRSNQRRARVLQISCSPTSKVLFGRDVERAFENLNPDTDLVLAVTDDRSCVGHVVMGRSDAAFMGVPLSKNERGKGLSSRVLGAQLVVPIVHPNNSVTTLVGLQLQRTLDGRISHWGELGWLNHQIQPVCLAEDWREDAPSRLLRFGGDALQSARLLGAHERIIQYVSEDPRALGLVPLAVLQRNRGKVRPLQIDHNSPTIYNLDRGAWPLGSKFRLVYVAGNVESLRGLLALLDSRVGQQVLGRKLTLP